MALSIDEMRAKMNSIAAGAPVPVVKLEESAESGNASGSASVEALRNQLLGKMVPRATPAVEQDPVPGNVRESVQSPAKSYRELLEEVINSQIRVVKEEAAERDQLRERVGAPRLDILRDLI